MSWNYRVIRSQEPNGGFYYAIHECYYDGDRLPHRWTASPVSVSGETHAELLTTLQQMHRAVLEPVLEQCDERLVEIGVETANDAIENQAALRAPALPSEEEMRSKILDLIESRPMNGLNAEGNYVESIYWAQRGYINGLRAVLALLGKTGGEK